MSRKIPPNLRGLVLSNEAVEYARRLLKKTGQNDKAALLIACEYALIYHDLYKDGLKRAEKETPDAGSVYE